MTFKQQIAALKSVIKPGLSSSFADDISMWTGIGKARFSKQVNNEIAAAPVSD